MMTKEERLEIYWTMYDYAYMISDMSPRRIVRYNNRCPVHAELPDGICTMLYEFPRPDTRLRLHWTDFEELWSVMSLVTWKDDYMFHPFRWKPRAKVILKAIEAAMQ